MNDERDDPQAILIDPDGPPVSNGQILPELDPQGQRTGFQLFVPTDDEKERMEDHLGDEFDIADQDYGPIREAWAANTRAYEALPDGDKDDFLQLPTGKTAVNHLVAFYVNRIYNKRPIASIDPEEFGQYEVPIPDGPDPFTGEMMSRIEMRSAEEIADGGEDLLQHYLKKKIPFHRFLYDLIFGAVRGSPGWGETCYERTSRPQMVPKWSRLPNGMVVADGAESIERVIGSPHKLLAHAGDDVMMASPWLDPQESEWLSLHAPVTPGEFRHKLKNNEFYLVDDEDERELLKSYTDLRRYEYKREMNDAKKVRDVRPRQMLDVYKTWLYWPVVFMDADGQDMEGIFSLLCQFERTTRKLLSCALNPYAHGRRTLVPYYQRPKPHSMGSYSTMEDVLPLQKVKTRLFHSQVQNAMLANTVFAKVRPGSTAWKWLQSNEIRARSKVPVQNASDFESAVLGRELRSLAPEIAGLDSWAKELGTSDTVRGSSLPGRTSRAAISLVQEAGLTVPNMDLDFLRESLNENLTMLFRDFGQWAMYGEEIPFQKDNLAIVMKAIEFPIDGLNQFSVRVNASSDEETAQFEFERDLGLAKLQGEKFAEAAAILGPMLSPQAPPVVEEFQKPMLVAHYELLGRIFDLAKMDKKKYVLTEKQIDEKLARHKEWIVAEQQRKMEEQIVIQTEAIRRANAGGGGAVVQGAFGGGPGGAGAPTNPEGAAGVGAPSGDAGLPQAPPMGV